ncbi:MAG: hypothetical protein ACOC3Z_02180 [Nanoarchaeota archaeon]
MNFFNIGILLFLLSAFMFGVGVQDQDIVLIDNTLDNVSNIIDNIDLDNSIDFYDLREDSSIPNTNGLIEIIEQGIKFVGVLSTELFRAGSYFGHDNPEYFSPEFILKIVKWIMILLIVSLLIKPISYLVVLLIIFGIWIKDKRNKKNKETKIIKYPSKECPNPVKEKEK